MSRFIFWEIFGLCLLHDCWPIRSSYKWPSFAIVYQNQFIASKAFEGYFDKHPGIIIELITITSFCCENESHKQANQSTNNSSELKKVSQSMDKRDDDATKKENKK